jgi:two-component system, cell cycle sensor histidine kinase and response regulator CckA
LEQVIVNLVSNARDAVEMGGTITLRVRPEQAGEVAECCPFCVLEVEDDGVGMDEATQAKAFEPFFTTKPANRGTGLGLSVVANVVGQCGGRIELSSEPKKGTLFRLMFPRRDRPATLIQPAAQVSSKIAGGGRLVLVVEDERMLRNTIERTLRRQGFEVTVAEDVDDALFRIRRCRFAPVLLISDVILPDGTGLDVAARVHEKWSQVPTLFISGYAGEQAALMGAPELENLLQKPFMPQTLMSRIDQILDGR